MVRLVDAREENSSVSSGLLKSRAALSVPSIARSLLPGLLVAVVLLLIGELAPAVFPVWVTIEVTNGADIQVSMDGATRVFHVPTGRQYSRVRFVEPGPVDREHQIDGSDAIVRLDRNHAKILSLQGTPLYQLDAWLRDEGSYSRWEHVRITDLDSGAVVADSRQAVEQVQLPARFRLEAGLRRPESLAQLWLSTSTPVVNGVLEISRTRAARWLTGPEGTDEAAHWFFPEEPLPLAAGLLQLLGRVAVAAYGLLAGMLAIGWVLTRLSLWERPASVASRVRAASHPLALGTVCAVWLAAAIWISVSLYHQLPHLLDASTYYFQAKLVAAGRLWLDAPPLGALFTTDLQTIQDGRWLGQYPPGAPAIYALGLLVGLSWLIGPLCALVSLACTALAARELFGNHVGLATLALGLISPMVLFLSGSFMSEPLSTAWLAAALLAFIHAERLRQLRWYAAAGALLGAAFITREYSASLFAVPIAGWLLAHRRWRGLVTLGVAGVPFLLAYLAYNAALTGDPFSLPRNLVDPTDRFGFGTFGTRHHTLAAGLGYTDINLTFLQFDLFGWPPLFALSLPLLPFLLGKARREDVFLASGVAVCIAGFILVPGHGAQLGPRYYYTALPYLLPLAARGIQAAVSTLRSLRVSSVAARAGALGVIGLLCINTFAFYFPGSIERRTDYLSMVGEPGRALPFIETTWRGPKLVGFTGPALVLVTNSELFKTLSALNCPLLDPAHIQDCEVLFVGAGKDRIPQLTAAYPGRTVLMTVLQDREVSLVPVPSPSGRG